MTHWITSACSTQHSPTRTRILTCNTLDTSVQFFFLWPQGGAVTVIKVIQVFPRLSLHQTLYYICWWFNHIECSAPYIVHISWTPAVSQLFLKFHLNKSTKAQTVNPRWKQGGEGMQCIIFTCCFPLLTTSPDTVLSDSDFPRQGVKTTTVQQTWIMHFSESAQAGSESDL